MIKNKFKRNLRRPGIEPGSRDWETRMIPLHQRHTWQLGYKQTILFNSLFTNTTLSYRISFFVGYPKAINRNKFFGKIFNLVKVDFVNSEKEVDNFCWLTLHWLISSSFSFVLRQLNQTILLFISDKFSLTQSK